MGVEKALLERICPNCHVALMYPHEQMREWEKCELCGYCEKQLGPEVYSPPAQERATIM